MSASDNPALAGATGIVAIDLAALAANWRALAKLVAPADCGAVVKADAYGLGAVEIIPALERAGCRTFFVATPDEAAEARALALDAAIYVLDGLVSGGVPTLLAANARPVLSSLAEAREWAAVAGRAPAAVHVDTGLNRLGMPPEEWAAFAADASLRRRLDLRLMMSHLACADDPAHPMNQAQRSAFESARTRLPDSPASLAASDGLMLGPEYHYDLVRPGYALYGGQAAQRSRAPVSPVVTVKARVLQVREVPAGATVGYSATYTARTLRRIATVAAGYADGFARGTGVSLDEGTGRPGGAVSIRGVRAPVVGRVSMDLITVDVTDVPGSPIACGEWAILIGQGLSLEDVGAGAGTIGYEVLTRLGRRFYRLYV